MSQIDGANERAGSPRFKGIKKEDVGGGTCFSYNVYKNDNCSGSSEGPFTYRTADSVKDGCVSGQGVSHSVYCDASGYHMKQFYNADCEGVAAYSQDTPNGCSASPFGDGFITSACGPCPWQLS